MIEWDSKCFVAAPGFSVHERSRIPTSIAVSRLTSSGVMQQQCIPHSLEAGAALSEEAIAHHLGVLSPRFYTFSAEFLLYTYTQMRSKSLSHPKILFYVEFIEVAGSKGPKVTFRSGTFFEPKSKMNCSTCCSGGVWHITTLATASGETTCHGEKTLRLRRVMMTDDHVTVAGLFVLRGVSQESGLPDSGRVQRTLPAKSLHQMVQLNISKHE